MFCIAVAASQCKSSQKTSGPKPAPPGSREMAFRKDVVAYAAQFKGSKYLYAGKTPKTGFDCSGFTSYVFSNFDIKLSPASREQEKQGKSKNIRDAQPGDLVFFRRSKNEAIFHVSLVKSNSGKSLVVIHSTTSRGVIEEDVLNSTYWRPYLDSVRDVISK